MEGQPTASHPSPTASPSLLGSQENPIVVDWEDHDVQNPYNWSRVKKLVQTYQVALGTFCVALGSSSYSGGIRAISHEFHIPGEIAVLGISFYVLGFGLGPLLFAPLSEMYGRRIIFLTSWTVFTFAHLGARYAISAPMLLVFRLIAGTCGSAPLAGGGGAIADMFIPSERGFVTALYSMCPFMGPILGPVIGGYLVQKVGWRRIFLLLFILSAILLATALVNMSETYTPVLLRRRARRLHKESGGKIHYISKYDIGRSVSLAHLLRTNLSRPFIFLVTEPIVTLLAIYISLAYATLYAMFSSYPIVFQLHRGWSPGKGGLPFLAIGAGVMAAMCFVPLQNWLYIRAANRSPTGKAPPEARLVMCCFGTILMPIGLFWFAWTTPPSQHAALPIAAGAPFGMGIFFVFTGLTAYIMDTYTIYCASALAATIVMRSMLAAVFPVMAPPMFFALGDQWGCSVFAFISLACAPMPLLFYRYGAWIRSRSRYATALEVPRAKFELDEKPRPADVEA